MDVQSFCGHTMSKSNKDSAWKVVGKNGKEVKPKVPKSQKSQNNQKNQKNQKFSPKKFASKKFTPPKKVEIATTKAPKIVQNMKPACPKCTEHTKCFDHTILISTSRWSSDQGKSRIFPCNIKNCTGKSKSEYGYCYDHDNSIIKDGFPENYRLDQKGVFEFEAIPTDVRLMIFRRMVNVYDVSVSQSKNLGRICKSWFLIFRNINFMVKIWDLPLTGYGYINTKEMLSCTLAPVNQGTIPKLVFTYDDVVPAHDYSSYYTGEKEMRTVHFERYADCFSETYHPAIFKNMRKPSLEEIRDSLDFFRQLLRRAPQTLIEEYWALIERTEEHFGVSIYEILKQSVREQRIDAVFAQKIICMPCVPKYSCVGTHLTYADTSFLEIFTETFDLTKDYDEYDCRVRTTRITQEEGVERFYSSIFNEILQFHLCFDRFGVDTYDEFLERFEKFSDIFQFVYRKLPTSNVCKKFLWCMNAVENQYKKKDSSTIKYMGKMETLFVQNADVHPLAEILVYDWYTPYNSGFGVYNKELEEQKWRAGQAERDRERAAILEKKRRALANRRRMDGQVMMMADAMDFEDDFYDDETSQEKRDRIKKQNQRIKSFANATDVDSEELDRYPTDDESDDYGW